MEREKLFDLIAVVVIAGVGLITAFVTFGILQSQAKAEIQNYSVGGAIAGALVTASLLASVYLQFRKSSAQEKELRNRIEELQQKLIRGAPCPADFQIELSEREKLVLARPQAWAPRGGILFDLVDERGTKSHPRTSKSPENKNENESFGIGSRKTRGKVKEFPARFSCWCGPTREDETAEKHYEDTINNIDADPSVESYTSEYIYIGGETDRTKSLKVISHRFAEVFKRQGDLPGSYLYDWRWIPKNEYEQLTNDANGETDQNETSYPAKLIHMTVFTHAAKIKKYFVFLFYDDENDFAKSSDSFSQILDSIRFLS